MLPSNFLAFLVTFGLAWAWLRLNDWVAARGWISGPLSRKVIHIGTGPIFVLCWLFFQDTFSARFWAALVPLGITLQFLLIGMGVIKDEAAVMAMTRHGQASEILRGPLFYGIVFVLLTLVYWHDSPIGLIALMLLCGGDGLADVLGKRIPSPSLPWSRGKTVAGSLAMLLGGWIIAALVLGFFILMGAIRAPLSILLGPLFTIATLAAVVESLPLSDLDNLTVPAAAILAGHFLLG